MEPVAAATTASKKTASRGGSGSGKGKGGRSKSAQNSNDDDDKQQSLEASKDNNNGKDENNDVDKPEKFISRRQANSLLVDSELAIQKAVKHLHEARELAKRAGLSIDSRIIPKPRGPTDANDASSRAAFAAALDPYSIPGSGGDDQTQIQHQTAQTVLWTGGYSNTDHEVVMTGDERTDRIAELKRNLVRRYRAMQPENRGEDR